MKKVIQLFKDAIACMKGYMSCWQWWVINLILILILCFCLNGCSFLPRLTFDSPNSVPQQTNKSKAKEICKGKAEFNEVGEIVSCSKGYYRYDENYAKKERKMTFVERIKSFINKLSFGGFILFGALLLFCPSAIGFVFGRIIEGTFGIAKKALEATVRGVQIFRKTGKNINDTLAAEQDSNVKRYIAKLKDKENIK